VEEFEGYCVSLPIVRQDRIGVDQHDRQAKGGWRRRQPSAPGAMLSFPDIGTIGRLGDLYKFTPLDPFTGAPGKANWSVPRRIGSIFGPRCHLIRRGPCFHPSSRPEGSRKGAIRQSRDLPQALLSAADPG